MENNKEKQKEQRDQDLQALQLKIDLPDMITEAYAKSFMAYRISLENWFLLNELLAYTRGEKLDSKEVQERLKKLFTNINTDIIREIVKLNQLAEKKASKYQSERKDNSLEWNNKDLRKNGWHDKGI